MGNSSEEFSEQATENVSTVDKGNAFHTQNSVINVAAEATAVGDYAATEIQIPVPWGHIAAKTYGNSNGKPVLAVHGWMDNAGTFDKLIPLLSKSLYIVAVDLPGHGLSSHLPLGVPYHFSDSIISLRRITSYFKWTKFSWIGHSMGAGLGVLYASSFPSHVNRFKSSLRKKEDGHITSKPSINAPTLLTPQVEQLVMLDLVKPLTAESGSDHASKIALAVDQFLALEEKIQPIPPVHSYDMAIERLIKGTAGSLSIDAAKGLMIRGARKIGEDQWSFNRDLRLRSPTIQRFTHDQCCSIIGKLRSPTMIIKASNGPWYEPKELSEEAIEIYKKNCAEFHYIEVEGNHFVHLNEPEKCAGHINQFLTGESKSNF